MKASVESMGGTTLEMMMPSTVAISRSAGEKRLRSRMPHSSAVCSWTVRSRHWQSSLRPSNAPMVMLLLPASRASSTNASCKYQGIGSVVLAHDQVARGIEAGGGAGDRTAGLIDGDAAAGNVAGGMREETEDGFGVFLNDCVDGREEGLEDVFAGLHAVGMEEQTGRVEVLREAGVVDVDPDAGDGGAIGQLDQDAGDFAAVEHEVVWPTKIADDAGSLRNGVDGGDAEGEGEQWCRLQHDAAVEAGSRFGVPGVSVAALPGGLVVGDDDGAERFSGSGALGGVEGVEAEDAVVRHESSSRKLMSMARAEWVMAPEETKSAPVSA